MDRHCPAWQGPDSARRSGLPPLNEATAPLRVPFPGRRQPRQAPFGMKMFSSEQTAGSLAVRVAAGAAGAGNPAEQIAIDRRLLVNRSGIALAGKDTADDRVTGAVVTC